MFRQGLRVPLKGYYKATIRVPLKGYYKGTIRVPLKGPQGPKDPIIRYCYYLGECTSRFLSNPCILRVLLIFSFNKGTLNQKGKTVPLRNLDLECHTLPLF